MEEMKAMGKPYKRQSPDRAVPNTPSQVTTCFDHDAPVAQSTQLLWQSKQLNDGLLKGRFYPD